jgi:hypothetical protein
MKNLFRHTVFGLFLTGIIVSSCVKDEYYLQNIKTPGWEPNFAAPLVNSRLTLWDILNDYDSTDIVVEDETHFLYLVYNSRVYSQSAEELISIPDQNVNTSNNFNTGGAIAVGDSFVTTFTYTYDFTFPNFQVIDSIYLKSGNLNLSINSNFNLPAKIELQLPGTKQGHPFKETIFMSSPNESQNIGLDNTKLLFSHVGGNNRLVMNFRVVLYGTGNPDLSPYNVDISNSFSDIRFRAMFGYLGQLNFALNEDTVRVKLYDNNLEGVVNWNDPRFYLTVTNYLGMPVQVDINYLEARRTKPPFSSVQILGPGIPNPWNILYPNFSQMGQGIPTSMYLDKTNSNIDVAYNISPQQVNALINAVSNPSGYTQNFTFDTSRFVVDAKVELPMHGTASGFVIVDTLDVNLGEDFEDSEYIDWVLFKIYAENGFPIDAKLQIYFLDSLYNMVDSLLSPPQQFIHAATPGPAPDYIVTTKYPKMITTIIYNDRLEQYHRIKYAVVRAEMETYNAATQIVKIYSYYDMHVMLGAQVQLKFN